EHDVRPLRQRPVPAEQRHPPLPQLLIVEVGGQVVAHLHDDHVRMQLRQPPGPELARDGLAVSCIDHHDEAIDNLTGLVDQMAVPEMGRAETTDDQSGRVGHRPDWMYSTRAVFSCSSSWTRCFTTSPMLTMPASSPSTTTGTWRIRRSVM